MRLVALAVAWCIGIGLAHHPSLSRISLWWLLAGAAGACVVWFYSDRRLRLPAFLLAALVLGGLRMASMPTSAPTARFNDRAGAVFTGTIIDSPSRRDNSSIQFTLAADAINDGSGFTKISGNVLVQTDPLAAVPNLHYGDRVQIHGTPITPPTIDSFDYADYLARSDIYTLLRYARVEIIDTGGGSPLIAWLLDIKTRLRATIDSALPDPAAGLLRGILLGDDALSDRVRADFAASGTAHLIAVSGFNLAVVAGVAAGLTRLIGGGRRAATLASIAATSIYALLVGLTGGVFRAWVMITVVIIGDLLRRRSYVPTSLALAIMLLTLIDPRDLSDVSFQMSAAAALGLAVLARPLSQSLNSGAAKLLGGRAHSISQAASDTLAATIAAYLFVSPFTAYYFSRISLVALPVNLLVAAFQPLLLLGGAVGALTGMLIPALGTLLLTSLWPALAWTLSVARGAARLPFAEVKQDINDTALLTFVIVIIGYLMLTASRPAWLSKLTATINIRTLLVTALLGALAVVSLSGSLLATRPDGRLHLWVLDVNGGNALLLQTPGGAHILVDGGSAPRRLLTAIGDHLPLNKRYIDLLIITAPQAWNINALLEVLPRYEIRSALIGDRLTSVDSANQIYAALPNDTSIRAQAGQRIEFSDGTDIEVLHPPARTPVTSDPGDTSLVLRVRYESVTFLLTGDLSRDGQQALIESGLSLHTDLIQIPGGGVDVHPDFIARAAASAAFVQSRTSAPLDLDVLEALPIPWWDVRATGDQHWWTDGHTLTLTSNG